MYMSPEVADRKPYGSASDTYGLGCVLLEMLVRQQLRERRPFETRKDYIREALDAARAHGWHAFNEMSDLAWRMLDENPKTRVALPTAAAAAATAASVLSKQQAIADACTSATAKSQNGAAESKPPVEGAIERARPSKRVAAEERLRRASTNERRRRLQYAD